MPSRAADGVCVMQMCSHFAQAGLKTILVIPDGKALSLEELGHTGDIWNFYGVPQNFKIIHLPKMFSRLRLCFSFMALIVGLVRKVSSINTRTLECACLAAVFRRPVVFESHNYQKVSDHKLLPTWIRFMKDPRRRVSMVVTTHAGKKSYTQRGIPADRIRVEPNGVNIQRFHSQPSTADLRKVLDLPEQKTIVGFCGSLYEGRGIEELLWNAEHLKRLFFLVVGGRPHEVDHYRNLSNEKNLDNIRFVGHVPQDQVPPYLMACDILLMPYTNASAHDFMSPMKMFDYLATGRPIVATDFPVVREILEDKKNAVLVQPDSATALADGILWLLDHPDQASQIGNQAREDARYYSWENRAKRLVAWHRQTLQGGPV